MRPSSEPACARNHLFGRRFCRLRRLHERNHPAVSLTRFAFFEADPPRTLRAGTDFIIHRRDGEVAEWSKALPC
jgi:hypothetical protein